MFKFEEYSFFNPSPNFREMVLLQIISKDSNVSQEILAKNAGIAPSMVNRYLKEFEEKKYINKVGKTRRSMQYKLTEDGIKRLQFLIVSYTSEVSKMYAETKISFDGVLYQIKNKSLKNIYLYGAGVVGGILLKVLNSENIEIKGFIDESPLKIGEKLYNIKIFSPESMKNKNYDAIIIASFRHYEEILKKAKNFGLKNIQIFKIDNEGKVSLKEA
ncbi:hypothetical protein OSSY52_04540 [Tepiditoga spiralis]|uniref:C-methyltransferase domain-containing protein n=1 Tax=Tepiditoga spiralis TaxID=2108365 RepID=A0A7G1G682_9BACT|nr:winged helix-turn-helix transcriptional regulator [Tepiditoga spiralis]BBE30313.1 hypothetical protein OSSY52_04540 [Tepiditoga spiralis]